MGKYVLNRLIMTVFVVIAAAALIFVVMFFIPGDPAKIIAGSEATVEMVETTRRQLGLDQPFLVQFGSFMYNTFIKFVEN